VRLDGRRIDLSIVVVNWNSLSLTTAALSSVAACAAGIECEIIVVDNGSRDGSVEALAQRFPQVALIANPDNRGFSRANNQGMRVARGRYVVLLNNDTVQIGNALGEAVRYMDGHPDVGALGIRHLNADEARSVQPSCFAFPRAWHGILDVLGVRLAPAERGPVLTERDVDWVCGSFLFVRRECLDAVGLLDERFFIYDEDIDWCRRAWNLGWKVRFWPGVAMVHLGAAARPYMRDKTFVHFRSRLSYITKHHSRFAGAVFYLAMSARLAGATASQLARFVTGRASAPDVGVRWRRQMQFLLLSPGSRGG
jgi:GT2 family glycosyltransferase